jgi:hypothetical protein
MSEFDKTIESLTSQEAPKINGIVFKGVDKTGTFILNL